MIPHGRWLDLDAGAGSSFGACKQPRNLKGHQASLRWDSSSGTKLGKVADVHFERARTNAADVRLNSLQPTCTYV